MRYGKYPLVAALLATVSVTTIANPAHAWIKIKNCDVVPQSVAVEEAQVRKVYDLKPGHTVLLTGYPVRLGSAASPDMRMTRPNEEYCASKGTVRLQRVMRNMWRSN